MSARTALLISFLLILPPASAADDAPLAVLMARQGEVTVMRGGDSLDAAFGMHLDQGDEIRTGEESTADIMFATGQTLQLGANGRLVVQGRDVRPTGGASPGVFDSTNELLQFKDSRGTSAIGRVRGGSDREILAISPRGSARVGTRPVFRWSGGSGELELTLERDGAVVWTGTVDDAQSLQYPDEAPELFGGASYAWRVRTSDPLATSPAESQTAFFETLTADEEAQLDRTLEELRQTPVSDSTRAILVAGVLYDRDLVDEAIGVIDAALDGGGDVEALQTVRENLRGAYWP